MESVSGLGLWLQYIALQILTTARLSTSAGVDVDSFVGDFGMTRLTGTAATGEVTFTSFSPAAQSATIEVGATVKTSTSLVFTVVGEASNPYWSSAAAGYIRPAGVSSVSLPVACAQAGSVGNVGAGAISLLGTALSGIDTVTNVVAFTNGSDGETDAQVRARFPLWLAAKSSATLASVKNAVSNVKVGLTDAIIDGASADLASRAGFFTVVVDDGSGAASDAVVSSVYSAVEDVRALGVGFAVQRPTVIDLNISMTIVVPAGTDVPAVQSAVSTAITSYINSTVVGSGFSYSYLPVLAYQNAGVSVVSISDVLLNGAQADIAAASTQVARAGLISITVQEAQ